MRRYDEFITVARKIISTYDGTDIKLTTKYIHDEFGFDMGTSSILCNMFQVALGRKKLVLGKEDIAHLKNILLSLNESL